VGEGYRHCCPIRGVKYYPQSGVSSLDGAITWLDANAANNVAYTIVLNAGETLNPTNLTGLHSADNVTITITTLDATERIIQLGSGNGSLFTVGESSGKKVNLILDGHITLKGRNNNTTMIKLAASINAYTGQWTD